MATNIPLKAAKALDESKSINDPKKKVKAIKEAISLIPKHKGTEKFIGNLRKRISRLEDKIEKREKAKKVRRGGIQKRGSAQVCLVGKENSGKTYLLNKLTNKDAKSTPVPFETQEPQVGMMDYEGVKIQLLDLPSITPDFYFKDDGPYLMNLVRNTDLVVITFKEGEPEEKQLEFLRKEFSNEGILFNEEEPRMKIKKTGRGEVNFIGDQNLKGDIEEYGKIMKNHNYDSAVVEVYSPVDPKNFKRKLENYAFKNTLILKNFTNAEQKIWKALGLMRVYTKEPGKQAVKEPMALEESSTVRDAAEKIHKDFLKKFRFAKIWGESSDFPGQRVGLDHELKEEDTIKFYLR